MWLLFIRFILTNMNGTAILTLVIRLQKLAGPAIGGVPAGTPFSIFLVVICVAKPFLSYNQQIQLLKSKHLSIEDEAAAERALHCYGYFSLVTGYKDLLKNPTTKNYQDGTTFQDLLAVYQFDEELRELTLRHLLHIERHIRSALSYAFCNIYGDSQSAYISIQNYDISTAKKNAEVTKLVNRYLLPLLNRPSNYPYIEHHKSKHNNVPLWVLINALTFGTVSKMYEYSNAQVQSAVGREFDFIREPQLRQILEVLTDFRNVCAHNERLFTHRCAKHDIPDLRLHQKLSIPKRGQEYIYGKRDYFSVVMAFRYLLLHAEFLTYKRNLANLIDRLCKKTQKITEPNLRDMMGLPENWKKITRYKRG